MKTELWRVWKTPAGVSHTLHSSRDQRRSIPFETVLDVPGLCPRCPRYVQGTNGMRPDEGVGQQTIGNVGQKEARRGPLVPRWSHVFVEVDEPA